MPGDIEKCGWILEAMDKALVDGLDPAAQELIEILILCLLA